MAEKYSLKDDLFNRDTVSLLAGHFETAGVFAAHPFVVDVMAKMPALELKARINLIAQVLARHLPQDFSAAADAISAALPPPLDPAKNDDDFGHFIYAPLGVFVENHGLERDFDRSLDLIEALTQRFSMEFSIRAFMNQRQDATLERMLDWVRHDSYHVRRLVSEGTRPRLPWGQNVGLAIADSLPFLDQLHADSTRFVTRSVANHLNDISKTAADACIDRLVAWQAAGMQQKKELDWMRRHALRGLLKAGNARAMQHLGYHPDVALEIADFAISPDLIRRGDRAAVSLTLTTQDDAPLMVDYVIDFVKANGKTAPRVFKLKTLTAKAGDPLTVQKSHYFKDDATTFVLYSGAHRIHLQVNGRIVATRPFTLT
ncbi:hypothetical protein [Yoonia sediminilitoris]|uniref:3-methyladenine DNA glycosylase AlkC n=1 Tax=Yoonia sediminilitoris TaxID=1286148 RepID=A0A2T6KDW4_9RHOB|nr:hypothetical protein [Yoonia sediminilitoris]PUB13219.1 3-methyladenine DNA glycosylase AlkC [Yoonia sediminilitoris]RCW94554.1 3-methyladenine DNA glycosylase AlkC [Yoonia sediminilitoris]